MLIRAGSTPVTRTSRQCRHPKLGWRQQRSEPYHTMVGFGFIFITRASGKLPPPIIGDMRCYAKLHTTMAVFGFKAHASTNAKSRKCGFFLSHQPLGLYTMLVLAHRLHGGTPCCVPSLTERSQSNRRVVPSCKHGLTHA